MLGNDAPPLPFISQSSSSHSSHSSSIRQPLLKIVMVGDGGVGKTCIRNKFLHGKFTNAYKVTIGADFITKDIEIHHQHDTKRVSLQIWDTAGQERFQSLGVAFYRGADACILVYDVTQPASLEHLTKWMEEFVKHAGISDLENYPFILVGNKADDTQERRVTKKDGMRMARLLKKRLLQKQSGHLEQPLLMEKKSHSSLFSRLVEMSPFVQRPPGSYEKGWAMTTFDSATSEPILHHRTSKLHLNHEHSTHQRRYSIMSTTAASDYTTANEEDDMSDDQGSQASSFDASDSLLGRRNIIHRTSYSQLRSHEENMGSPSSRLSTPRMSLDRPCNRPNRPNYHPHPQTPIETANQVYEAEGFPLFETSAKLGTRVEDAFYYIASTVDIPVIDLDILPVQEPTAFQIDRDFPPHSAHSSHRCSC